MPQNFTNEKSILVNLKTRCRQATSHCLGQCWPGLITPYGVTSPQRVEIYVLHIWLSNCYNVLNGERLPGVFNIVDAWDFRTLIYHYSDFIMSAIASPFSSITIVYSTIYSGPNERKHQSFASLTFVRGIHRWPVISLQKWPVTRIMFPFDDVIKMLRVRSSVPRLQTLNLVGVLPLAGIVHATFMHVISFCELLMTLNISSKIDG